MNSKKISFLLALCMIATLVASPVSVLAKEATTKTITIIHTNDVHGRAEETAPKADKDGKVIPGEIGMAKLKTYVDSKGKDTLLFDMGDMLHGTNFANLAKGESMIELMNILGYDAMTLGNHDFNYGYEQLLKLKEEADFPILVANIERKDGNDSDFAAHKIFEDVNGVKVGVFAIATPESAYKSNPKNTAEIEFTDYIKAAKKQVAELKEADVDVIIALSHLGLDESSKERSDILAKEVPGIDLILDGHSHTSLLEGKYVGDTLIAQTGGQLTEVGEVTLTFDSNNKLIYKNAKTLNYDAFKGYTSDAKIVEKIAAFNEANDKVLKKVVGETAVELEGAREKVRTGETNLGNLLTDAMLDVSGADIAITNGGGIRASIDAGEITHEEIITAFPFLNYPVLLEVKGTDVLAALEFGVNEAPEAVGKFPHVAGITFKYDPEQPAGKRVFDVKVGDEDLDLEKNYKVVTNDFMAIGGDGYEMFKDAKELETYGLLSEVLESYIAKKGKVSPEVEGRITVAKNPETEKPAPESKFTDISGHWAEKYILSVTESGIFKGMTETTFEPQTKITRGMVVTTLGRLVVEEKDLAKASKDNIKFNDVDADAWYADYVLWASNKGIVEGYEDGSFKPNQEVSRQELATIFGRFLEKYNFKLTKDRLPEFADQKDIADWALMPLDYARKAALMEGREGNIFDPKGTATRAELAKVMFQLEELIEKGALPELKQAPVETQPEAKPEVKPEEKPETKVEAEKVA